MPLRRCLPILAGLLLTACSLLGSPVDVPSNRLPVPRGYYYDVAWLSNGWLIVNHHPYPEHRGGPIWSDRLWQLRSNGRDFAPLPLAPEARCRRTGHLWPLALPDGRLGFQVWCVEMDNGSEYQRRYWAYDLATGATTPLSAADPLMPLGPVTWNPMMTRGLIGGRGICGSIIWLTPGGLEFSPFSVRDGDRSWRLDSEFLRQRSGISEPCTQEGLARNPAWSPDGATIAFFCLATGNWCGRAGPAQSVVEHLSDGPRRAAAPPSVAGGQTPEGAGLVARQPVAGVHWRAPVGAGRHLAVPACDWHAALGSRGGACRGRELRSARVVTRWHPAGSRAAGAPGLQRQ